MIHCPNCGEENPAKFRLCGYCGTPLAAAAALPAQEVRKTVTIVFSDLKGSTALGERLDAEALHEVKDRYFSAMAIEISRHGGKIEKYIGDAIMAVFGLPRAHEDDALRAVRAAAAMQAVLLRVNEGLRAGFGVELVQRIGVNTGEVVAHAQPGKDNQKLATGDAVNVAARLEQAAGDNAVYLGETTWRLVRDAVEVEPVAPLELKGKVRPVPAFRLVSARGQDGNARRHDTPVVGRDADLAALLAVYDEVRAGPAVRLATVVGDAGVGKTRLVREAIERIGAAARVLRGRCLPYGDGITFWPLRQMICEAADIRDDDPPEAARARLLAIVDPDVAARLESATGMSTAAFPLQELYWATRRFLETLAAHGPVVAFIDDIHWAEPAFLDLLEHVLDAGAAAPILLLATTRHDLLEQRAQWSELAGATTLVLAPLDDEGSARVVANLLGSAGLPDEVVARIVRAAEGNPLFVEQMLSMLIDSRALRLDDGRWVRTAEYRDIAVPPTIQALLEARLDQLGRNERAAVEPASVIGLEFPQPAVESLAPEALRNSIGEQLAALTRKQFIRPAAAALEAAAIYRFHHQLVRDTIYNGLLKRARATLHANFVRWADAVNGDRMLEFQEILGYHLEQAHRYLSELGPLGADGVALGADAARRLGGAGRRAFARGDMHAAANLYRRAAALLGADNAERLALLPELAEALMEQGAFNDARTVLTEIAAAAERIRSVRLATSARLIGLLVRLHSAEEGDWSEDALRIAHEAIPVLERDDAHRELATAWRVIVIVHGVAGRYREVGEAVGPVIEHARRAGDDRLAARIALPLATTALLGPTPVLQAIEQCESIVAGGLGDRQVESVLLCTLAQLRAMNGDFEPARALLRRGRALLRDLGQGVNAASTGSDLACVELLAGDLAGAEREVRADYEFLERQGETYFLATMAALLARIVLEQGRNDEALALSQAAERNAAADDLEAQAMWRSVRAPIVARAGDLAAAESLVRDALDFARRTEAPVLQADALVELAAVLRLGGREADAASAIGEAIALYEAKGDRVSAARSRAWAEGG